MKFLNNKILLTLFLGQFLGQFTYSQSPQLKYFNDSNNSFPSNVVNSISYDSDYDNKWIGTEIGVVIIDKENNIKTIEEHLGNNEFEGISVNKVCLIEDFAYIGAYENGIIKISKNLEDNVKITKYPFFETGHRNNIITDIIKFNDLILVATDKNGVFYLGRNNVLISLQKKLDQLSLPSANILCLAKVNDELWIGTDNGLAVMDNIKTKIYRKYRQVNKILFEDKKSIFISFVNSEGVSLVKVTDSSKPGNYKEVKEEKKWKDVIRKNAIFKSMKREHEYLWVLNTNLIGRFKNKAWEIIDEKKLGSNFLTDLFIEDSCTAWIGTEDIGLIKVIFCNSIEEEYIEKKTVWFNNRVFSEGDSINFRILFEGNKNDVKKNSPVFRRLVSFLKSNDVRVDIIGHTSPQEEVISHQDYFKKLSISRAKSLKLALIEEGVSMRKIRETDGMGARNPLPGYDNFSEEHKRVEIRIVEIK